MAYEMLARSWPFDGPDFRRHLEEAPPALEGVSPGMKRRKKARPTGSGCRRLQAHEKASRKGAIPMQPVAAAASGHGAPVRALGSGEGDRAAELGLTIQIVATQSS